MQRRLARLSLVAAVIGCLFVGTAPKPAYAATTWLDRINQWRASTGVPQLAENTSWAQGEYNHSLYMVKNDTVTHYEVSTMPYYTVDGDTAARNGNIEVSSTTATTDVQAIDWWMGAPFHAMGMMDPRLAQTEFGSYREVKTGWQAGFTIDVLRGNPWTGGTYPVYFPGNGSIVPLNTYSGNEFPDPLQDCPGYASPTGLPVFIQIGGNITTTVTAHSFTGNGVALAHCVLDGNSPNVGSTLYYRGGAVVIPQQPLVVGVKYIVNLTVNGVAYSWSFGVDPGGSFTAGAPTSITAVAGNATATVSWNPPANNGGSAITTYVVTPYIGANAQTAQTVAAPTTTATFTGLTNNTTYWFSVAAVNAAGNGPAASSNSVTPSASGMPPSTVHFFSWFDNATLGMNVDNFHVLNTSASAAHVTINMQGTWPLNITVPAGAEQYVSFPGGSIGGPVVLSADQQVLASQRVQYFSSFNEVWSTTAAQAATTSYISWFDRASLGMVGDNIHVVNPGNSSASVTVSMNGASPINFNLAAGAESYVGFPAGTIGGPVKITSTQPVLASQRVQYYQTFNEVLARSSAQASTSGYFNWFDKASAGMVSDNVHIVNPGTATASGTVSVPGQAALNFSVAAGAEAYVSFPSGVLGGPVHFTSDNPVLASQRVEFYQSFNEVPAATATDALATSHIMWFDRASVGMVGDNIHLLNPGSAAAHVTVSLAGATPIPVTVQPGAESYVTFPAGTMGGPVVITSDQPVLAAQRVEFFSTFNEVAAA